MELEVNQPNLLLDLPQELICQVIDEVGDPIQYQQLAKLLNLRKDFQDRIKDCVRQIDFTNGASLINGYEPPLVLSDHTPTVTQAFIESFPRLTEYRIVHYGSINDSLTNYLATDPRARYLSLIVDSTKGEADQAIKLVHQSLTLRIAKYGSGFTFHISNHNNTPGFNIVYSNGILLCFMQASRASLTKLYKEFFKAIPPNLITTYGQSQFTAFDDPFVQYKAKLTPKRIVVYANDGFGTEYENMIGEFNHGNLDTLEEILFRPLIRNPQPHVLVLYQRDRMRLTTYVGRNQRIVPGPDLRGFLLNLLHGGKVYLRMLKFELPIPQALRPQFQVIFPNVTQWNLLEDYIEAYLEYRYPMNRVNTEAVRDEILYTVNQLRYLTPN